MHCPRNTKLLCQSTRHVHAFSQTLEQALKNLAACEPRVSCKTSPDEHVVGCVAQRLSLRQVASQEIRGTRQRTVLDGNCFHSLRLRRISLLVKPPARLPFHPQLREKVLFGPALAHEGPSTQEICPNHAHEVFFVRAHRSLLRRRSVE